MISFNNVPIGTRVPFTFVEFDGSNANGTATAQAYKVLMLGQKLDSGSAVAEVPYIVASTAQAIELFGKGSMLHNMVDVFFKNNDATELHVMSFKDPDKATPAQWKFTFDPALDKATKADQLTLNIAGEILQFDTTPDMKLAELLSTIASKVTSQESLPVTVAATANEITFISKHKADIANQIVIELSQGSNFQLKDPTPKTKATNGQGISLSTAFSKISDTHYNFIINPYETADVIKFLEGELVQRFSPSRALEAIAISAVSGKQGEVSKFLETKTSPHTVYIATATSQSPGYLWASALTAVTAYYGNLDTARPFQTLPILGVVPPQREDQFTMQDRNVLLSRGASTFTVDSGDNVRIERLVTTYKNSNAPNDMAYVSLNTLLTLSFIRFSIRSYFSRKYPRCKLASDAIRLPAGASVMTPSLMKAELVCLFRTWETELGIVENVDQFKNDLICEINQRDKTRLDVSLTPKLVSQFCILGVKVGFLL